MKRKYFGRVFEGKKQGEGIPQVTLRRLTQEELDLYCMRSGETQVGIFHGPSLIATVDFNDLFDESGNRFYNDMD